MGTTFALNIERKHFRSVRLQCLLLLVPALLGCSQEEDSKQQALITLGAIFSITNASSFEGIHALNGVQLAKTEINESRGELGKKIDIVVLNDRGDLSYSLQQYNVLKNKGAAPIIIASANSAANAAILEASERDGIPVILLVTADLSALPLRDNIRNPLPILHSSESRAPAQFVGKYYFTFHHKPPLGAIAAYESVYILLDALKKAGDNGKVDIISAIDSNERNSIPGYMGNR